jgi:hypothetical protein
MTNPSPNPPNSPNSKPDDLPPLIKQGIRDTIQSILLLSPFGVAGFLVTQNQLAIAVLVAILGFVARVFYVVWKNSTDGFIEGIKEPSRQWGINLSTKYLPEWLKNRFEDIKWRFSKVEKNYLDCLAEDCLWLLTDGYRQDRQGKVKDPTLEEVFVHLRVNSSRFDFAGNLTTSPLGSRREELREIKEEQLSIWEVLARSNEPSYRRVLINAWGGFGKTTLLRHVAYTYGKNPAIPRRHKVQRFIPFLLYLRENKITDHIDLSLPELITQHYLPPLLVGRKLRFPNNWVENLLHEGKALIFFDGFDEVKEDQKSAMSEWIGKQMAAYPRSVFILTSRPDGYKEGYTATEKPYREITIEPLDKKQWGEFISKWYFCQLRESRSQADKYSRRIKRESVVKAQEVITQINKGSAELQKMVSNPLLLKIILTVYYYCYGEEKLPQLETLLYEDIFKLVLETRPEWRGIVMPLRPEERRIVLQKLALDLVVLGESELDKSTVLAKLTEYLQGFPVSAEEFLSRITRISELLIEKGSNKYQFAHNKFRDYLAAKEIERCKNSHLLVEQGENSQWQDTTFFYVEIVENPTIILQELVNNEALDRAYNCLRKLDNRKYTPPIAAKLKDIEKQICELRYTKLEEYMQAGQWQEADELTYTVMIGVLRKEVGDYFIQEELLNFPCEDLLKIDGLWLKYSQVNGLSKFGFSVQKEIIKKCGYKLDGSDPPLKVLYDFSHEVGWRDKKTEKWRASTYTLDRSTKVGSLPRQWRAVVEVSWRGGGFELFSRISHQDL